MNKRHLVFCAGVVWGLSTSFAYMFAMPMLVQGLGLLIGCLAALLASGAYGALRGIRTPLLLLLLAQVVALAIAIYFGVDYIIMVRIALLVPAVLAVGGLTHESVRESFVEGLMTAGAVFVGYHFAQIDFGALFDPSYRLSVFLNTNSVGFVAAMTGIAAITRVRVLFTWRMGYFAALWVACVTTCIATKSRTASIALLIGTFVALWLNSARNRVRLSIAALLVLTAIQLAGFSWGGFAGEAAMAYDLRGKYRPVGDASFRRVQFEYALSNIFLAHPMIGIGPGESAVAIGRVFDFEGLHNGFLTTLCDTGIIGSLPIAAFLLCLGFRAYGSFKAGRGFLAFPLIVAGVVESMAENELFNYGSAGSLLFLAAVTAVCVGWSDRQMAEQCLDVEAA